tara:strand:+ start:5576 stop:5980 length:405 start_codon:yes stop_codon:yes gene_type:complete
MSKEIQKAAGTKVTFIMPDTESIGQLEEMDVKYQLNIKYKSADDWAALKDQPVRAFYMGIKEVPNEDGEMIMCGLFATPKEVFISGQTTLIEAVKMLPPSNEDFKTAVQITYRGKKANKSTDGSTMIFDVEKLG